MGSPEGGPIPFFGLPRPVPCAAVDGRKEAERVSRKKVRVPWLAAMLLLGACGGGAAARPEPESPRPVEPPPAEPAAAVRVGAILPLGGGGAMQQYGALVRQGVDIALAEHAQGDGPAVELVVADDAGDAANAARALAELESGDVVAVIGPLLEQALAAAANARATPDLALISPTAPAGPQAVNAFALNTEDTRGAETLAQFAVRRGHTRIGLLYPRTEDFRRLAQAFRSALQAAGGTLAVDVGYDPNTTTFAQPMERLRTAGVDVVYAPATERIIRQLAPQFEYYGLGAVQILGSDGWTTDEVLRMVPARNLEGVVATTPLLRTSDAVAWDRFVGLYEAAHRRTLDTPYPALGYDAARLVLDAIQRSGGRRPGDVARALASTTDFRGATGVLSLTGGAVTRRPFLVQIRSGRLTPLDGTGN
jgi:branched-chain amino acid transport system substrate-binding protein